MLTFQIHKTEETNLSGNAENADCNDQAAIKEKERNAVN